MRSKPGASLLVFTYSIKLSTSLEKPSLPRTRSTSMTVTRKLLPIRLASGRLQPAPEIAPARISATRPSANPLCPPNGSRAPGGGP